MNKFESNEFALQVIAQGSFVDTAEEPGKAYQVEACTVRLNCVALGEWLGCYREPCRECFEAKAEWEAAKVEQEANLKAWEEKVKDILGLTDCDGVTISRAQSEVFTVVHIWEITGSHDEEEDEDDDEPDRPFIVEWNDHEGNQRELEFSNLEDALAEAAYLKLKYDYVRLHSVNG